MSLRLDTPEDVGRKDRADPYLQAICMIAHRLLCEAVPATPLYLSISSMNVPSMTTVAPQSSYIRILCLPRPNTQVLAPRSPRSPSRLSVSNLVLRSNEPRDRGLSSIAQVRYLM
ncbi:hypothetical protein FRB95_003196 [Tulasnella sp. JGI-2019a]|nr:hypothetical protein FRB95_003196 [Tulasnella sp. JGI-2019a]